jgi:hypothetical protein
VIVPAINQEAQFVRKLKRGSGKYKGKLPFKCFNCGRVILLLNVHMQKGKTVMMKTVMMKKNITIKANPINTKEENILRRRVFTLERTVAHLKKVMDVFMILTKKNYFSWPWIQSLLI